VLISLEAGLTKGKRKRIESDAEDDIQDVTENEDAQNLGEDDADEGDVEGEDYRAPRLTTATRRTKSKSTAKPKGPSPAKKPRVTKVPGTKQAKTGTKRGRKPKGGDGAYDAVQTAKDTKISADNALFSMF
jgi:cohesin complex subunit SA-1/2